MMIKRIFSLILVLSLLLLTGCAEVVRIDTEIVEATVVDTYYRPSWIQPIVVGKVSSMMMHPATYRVSLEYKEETYTLNSKDSYDICKDLKGEKIPCKLKIAEYNNGKVFKDILEILDKTKEVD